MVNPENIAYALVVFGIFYYIVLPMLPKKEGWAPVQLPSTPDSEALIRGGFGPRCECPECVASPQNEYTVRAIFHDTDKALQDRLQCVAANSGGPIVARNHYIEWGADRAYEVPVNGFDLGFFRF